MRAYLDGDRTCVFQWDNNRRLILDGFPDGCVVAYSNECATTAPVVESYTENGILYADIPPEIMQKPHCIEADIRMDGNTIHKTFVTLIPGPRPDDYVMEPVEVLRYETLSKRIAALEEGGVGGAALDPTLTQSGKAADAKATGDEIKRVEKLIPSIDGLAKTEDIPTRPEDIGAQPEGDYATTDDIPEVPSWAMQTSKPAYTSSEVGADPAGTASTVVGKHNVDPGSHNDIRLELQALSDRINAALNSDDVDLDQLAEIVAYIKSNKSLIDAITTSKVSVADIVDNLETNASNKPLSAAMGVTLYAKLTNLGASLSGYQPKGNYALVSAIPTKVSQLQNDSDYLPRSELDEALTGAEESGRFAVSSDWDQNDPTAPDYIKGRTHYAEAVESEITMTINPGDVIGAANADRIYEQRKTAKFEGIPTTSANGYKFWQDMSGTRNFLLYDGSNVVEVKRVSDDALVFYLDGTGDVPADVTFVGEIQKIHKLDAKYLPDGYSKGEIVAAAVAAVPEPEIASRLSLGMHTDGLLYLFVDGEPTGIGVELPSGGIGGYIDSDNNIVINGLPDGSYTVKYEQDDGSLVDIGALVVGETGPAYTNLAEPNPDNTSDFTIWCTNARMGGDGSVSARDGYTCTNFFEVTVGDVIRIQGFKIERLGFYDANKAALPSGAAVLSDHVNNNYIHSGYTQTDDATTFTVRALTPVYARLSGWVNSTADAVIITRNEEIV